VGLQQETALFSTCSRSGLVPILLPCVTGHLHLSCRQRSGKVKHPWSPGDKNQCESKNNIFQANRWPQNCLIQEAGWQRPTMAIRKCQAEATLTLSVCVTVTNYLSISYFHFWAQWKCEASTGRAGGGGGTEKRESGQGPCWVWLLLGSSLKGTWSCLDVAKAESMS
jgi:hypothetical protein